MKKLAKTILVVLALVLIFVGAKKLGFFSTKETESEAETSAVVMVDEADDAENSEEASSASEETTSEEDASSTEETVDEAEDVETINLDELVNSSKYDDWLTVAESEDATEKHLLTIAQKCVDGKYISLAEAVANNDACTSSVMRKLSDSDEQGILKLVAGSSKSDEQTLLTVATKATNNRLSALAEIVACNENCTSAIMRQLSYSDELSIMELVANSELSDEQSLLEIARKAANNQLSSLATKIKANPNVTSSVLDALGDL